MSTVSPRQVEVLPDGRMDTKNAAAYLDLSPKTLAMKRSSGTGPRFVKRGRVWYFRNDLDEWVARNDGFSTAQVRAKAAPASQP
jgi:hypothetical protein